MATGLLQFLSDTKKKIKAKEGLQFGTNIKTGHRKLNITYDSFTYDIKGIFKGVVNRQDIKESLIETMNDPTFPFEDYDIQISKSAENIRVQIKRNRPIIMSMEFYIPFDPEEDFDDKYEHKLNAYFLDELCFKINTTLKHLEYCSKLGKLNNARFARLHSGDTFEFGEFNGKPIEWYILEKKDDTLLALCANELCVREFSDDIPATWETSSLRYWLNTEFYQNSFSDEEKSLIATSQIKTGNSVTMEKFYILSIEEIREYLTDSPEDDCMISGIWIRFPGKISEYVNLMDDDGVMFHIGDVLFFPENGVCPVFKMKFF